MPKVLVIGSVHIDIIANYKKEFSDKRDKIGSLKYSIGGAAFNIAVNLATNDCPVSVFTILKKNSISSNIIQSYLNSSKINHKYVYYVNEISESGFVAHTEDGNLVSAVSCINIENAELPVSNLRTAIKFSDLVAIDTNLSVSQINLIVKLCKQYNKRLFVCNVSDSKIHRLLSNTKQLDDTKFDLVSLNCKEYEILIPPQMETNPFEICKKFCSKYVIVTHDDKGYIIFSLFGEKKVFPAIEVTNVKSKLGAGDALFAAICYHVVTSDQLNWEKCHQIIRTFLIPILMSEGATSESTIEQLL